MSAARWRRWKRSMPGAGSNWSAAASAGISRPPPISRICCAATARKSRKLSRAGIETLAIIAYHEPVTRAEIEAIRGVQISKGTIDVLMEAGWVRPAGRREVPGRPLTYATTAGFLSQFGLASRRDLPGIDDLKAAGLLDPVDLAFDDGSERNCHGRRIGLANHSRAVRC
jgi:hypothetical protein